jgi:hypothetical protein
LSGKIELTLWRRPPAGAWEPAAPNEGGHRVYQVGDRFAFQVVNCSGTPVFFNVLDFEIDFQVELVYPPAKGANASLQTDVPFTYGRLVGEELYAGLPAGFAAHQGPEVLKLIASTREIDFSWMRQGGVRKLTTPATALERLIQAFGTHTRGVTLRSPAGDEWTTVECPFLVTRAKDLD